jgi:hypothetical protein
MFVVFVVESGTHDQDGSFNPQPQLMVVGNEVSTRSATLSDDNESAGFADQCISSSPVFTPAGTNEMTNLGTLAQVNDPSTKTLPVYPQSGSLGASAQSNYFEVGATSREAQAYPKLIPVQSSNGIILRSLNNKRPLSVIVMVVTEITTPVDTGQDISVNIRVQNQQQDHYSDSVKNSHLTWIVELNAGHFLLVYSAINRSLLSTLLSQLQLVSLLSSNPPHIVLPYNMVFRPWSSNNTHAATTTTVLHEMKQVKPVGLTSPPQLPPLLSGGHTSNQIGQPNKRKEQPEGGSSMKKVRNVDRLQSLKVVESVPTSDLLTIELLSLNDNTGVVGDLSMHMAPISDQPIPTTSDVKESTSPNHDHVRRTKQPTKRKPGKQQQSHEKTQANKAKKKPNQSNEGKKSNKSKAQPGVRIGWSARVSSTDTSDPQFIRVVFMEGMIWAAGTDIKALVSGSPRDTPAEREIASANTTRFLGCVGDRNKRLCSVGSDPININKDTPGQWWWSRSGHDDPGQRCVCINSEGLSILLARVRDPNSEACGWLKTNLLPILTRSGGLYPNLDEVSAASNDT